MTREIVFLNSTNFNLAGCEPKPARTEIPDWYKNLDSYINKEKKPIGNGSTAATIKRCMPVFDAITVGYLICTHTDIFVSQVNEEPYYEWANFGAISFHPIEQAPTHPANQNISYPKFINPWSIKTPKGYSCLFVNPLHRHSEFSILEGIVDTDKYINPVNFPFVLKNKNFEGLIPKGTPVAQVIPFKRDSWKHSISNDKNKKEEINTQRELLNSTFFDRYKKIWWQTKSFK